MNLTADTAQLELTVRLALSNQDNNHIRHTCTPTDDSPKDVTDVAANS